MCDQYHKNNEVIARGESAKLDPPEYYEDDQTQHLCAYCLDVEVEESGMACPECKTYLDELEKEVDVD